ncbi:hypothetical protein V498_06977 [Pseudogymnoascus sp. VKM F-4517 (FW-2822)]|nr:hypothetical protein V498_06977 [Pseudogymnoascus sp. VKM F-4517 (FW-2822)]
MAGNLFSNIQKIHIPRSTPIPQFHLEAGQDLGLSLTKSPRALLVPTPDLRGLLSSEPLGHNSRVVTQSVDLSNLLIRDLSSSLAIRTLIHGDDGGTTKTEVVLQGNLCSTRDQTVVSPSTKVPHQLGALRDPRGAQGVALGDEAARGVDDVLPAVGDIAVADELVGLALLGQAEGVNRDHLVSGEAVVELDDLDVGRGAASLAQRNLSGRLGHVIAHQVDGALAEQAGRVGGEALARDEDGLGAEVGAGVEELLGDEDGGGASVGGRAALQLRERAEDGGRVEDLLARVHLLELRVGVALAVLVVDARDLGKVVVGRAVPLHVLDAGVAEHLGGAGGVGDAARLGHHHARGAGGVLAVVPEALQGAGVHLLEADDEDAVRAAVGDDITADVQAGRSGRAVVVDVVDGDLGHAELVEDALAARGVAVAVAGNTLVNVIVADLGVKHGLDTGLETELGVVNLSARLDELGHAYAEDVASLARGGSDHVCGLGGMRMGRSVCGSIVWPDLKGK